MADIKAPSVRLRRLTRALRRSREAVGLTVVAAAQQLGWQQSKLSRIETARTAPSVADVTALLDLYGTSMPERGELLQLTREAKQRGWWNAYPDVFHGPYVDMEDMASDIRNWEVQLIPGLLQTAAYARAVIGAVRPDIDTAQVEDRVRARIARQALLTRPDAPTMHAVLDEGVFVRAAVATDVMATQMRALLEAPDNVTLQVVPFGAGFHAGMDGAFVLLSFPEPEEPDVGYIETAGGEAYLEDAESVRRCTLAFDRIQQAALSQHESRDWIAKQLEEYQ